jgi:hypothetical protein
MSNALQQQKLGSAVILGTTSTEEVAFSATAMPALLGLLEQNMGLSESMNTLAFSELESQGTKVTGTQFPTLTHVGAVDQTSGEGHAVFVANGMYVHNPPWTDLEDALGESVQLQNQVLSTHPDQHLKVHANSDEMLGAYETGLSEAKPGDELLLHFAGHGAKSGLVGAEDDGNDSDVLSTGAIYGLASRAVSQGVHARIILDACHSGASVQRMRDEQFSASGGSEDDRSKVAIDAALTARQLKTELEGPLKTWGAVQQQTSELVDEAAATSVQRLRQDLQVVKNVIGVIKPGDPVLMYARALPQEMQSDAAKQFMLGVEEAVRAGDAERASERFIDALWAVLHDINEAIERLYGSESMRHAKAFDDAWHPHLESARQLGVEFGADPVGLVEAITHLPEAQRVIAFLDELQEAALARTRQED